MSHRNTRPEGKIQARYTPERGQKTSQMLNLIWFESLLFKTSDEKKFRIKFLNLDLDKKTFSASVIKEGTHKQQKPIVVGIVAGEVSGEKLKKGTLEICLGVTTWAVGLDDGNYLNPFQQF